MVINFIVVGYYSHANLAKYKYIISSGGKSTGELEKLDAKFDNGFIISAVLLLIIIALALLI